ncbi:hypothetical protein ACFWSF_32495 [Streptomyces sp. NPDC058611]
MSDADVDTLARTLIESGHLLCAGRGGVAPEVAEVRKVVSSVVAGAARH